MVLSDHEGGDRGALQDAVEPLFTLLQRLLGGLSLRDVLEGLNGAHEGALRIPDRRRREAQPAASLAEVREEIRRLEGLLEKFRRVSLPGVPLLHFGQFLVDDQIGHTGALRTVKGPPVLVRTDDVVGSDSAEFLQGPVPEDHLVVPVDHKRRDRGALEDLVEPLLALPERLLGQLLVRDVLESLHGADDLAVVVSHQGRREPQPSAALPQFGEKIRCLEGLRDQGGLTDLARIPPGDFLHGPVDEQVRHAGPLFSVKRPPVLVGADDRRGGDLADLLEGAVPVLDAVIPVDDKGRDEGAVDDAVKDALVRDERFAGRSAAARLPLHRIPPWQSEIAA